MEVVVNAVETTPKVFLPEVGTGSPTCCSNEGRGREIAPTFAG